jgi:hypothetical protein
MIRAQIVAKGTRKQIDTLVDKLQRDLLAMGYTDIEPPVIEAHGRDCHLVVAEIIRK